MKKKFSGLKLKETSPNRILFNLIIYHIEFCETFSELVNVLIFEAKAICNEAIIETIICDMLLDKDIQSAFKSLKKTITIKTMSEFKQKKNFHIQKRIIDKHYDSTLNTSSEDAMEHFSEVVGIYNKMKDR